jgi:hypothetical protein
MGTDLPRSPAAQAASVIGEQKSFLIRSHLL